MRLVRGELRLCKLIAFWVLACSTPGNGEKVSYTHRLERKGASDRRPVWRWSNVILCPGLRCMYDLLMLAGSAVACWRLFGAPHLCLRSTTNGRRDAAKVTVRKTGRHVFVRDRWVLVVRWASIFDFKITAFGVRLNADCQMRSSQHSLSISSTFALYACK